MIYFAKKKIFSPAPRRHLWIDRRKKKYILFRWELNPDLPRTAGLLSVSCGTALRRDRRVYVSGKPWPLYYERFRYEQELLYQYKPKKHTLVCFVLFVVQCPYPTITDFHYRNHNGGDTFRTKEKLNFSMAFWRKPKVQSPFRWREQDWVL